MHCKNGTGGCYCFLGAWMCRGPSTLNLGCCSFFPMLKTALKNTHSTEPTIKPDRSLSKSTWSRTTIWRLCAKDTWINTLRNCTSVKVTKTTWLIKSAHKLTAKVREKGHRAWSTLTMWLKSWTSPTSWEKSTSWTQESRICTGSPSCRKRSVGISISRRWLCITPSRPKSSKNTAGEWLRWLIRCTRAS